MTLRAEKHIYLMMTVTLMLGIMFILSVIQLFKVIHLQENNFLYHNNVTSLSEIINKYPARQLYTQDIISKLQEIKKQPEACYTMMNRVDKLIIKMVSNSGDIKICENDAVEIKGLILRLENHPDETINDNPYLIYELTAAIKSFTEHTRKLEKITIAISQFTITILGGLIIPLNIATTLLSLIILSRIGKKTHELKNSIEILETSKEQQQKLAYYDSLTSLPNRNLFTEILEHETHKAKRYKHTFALLYIDLDRFKFVNDTLGHDAGDDLLVQASMRFKTCIRESDFLARFGGDEFLLILPEITNQQNSINVADKINKEIAQPFQLGEHEVFVSASIGIAYCPDDTIESNALLKCADLALYEAKKNGKNQYHLYQEELQAQKNERLLSLEKDLHRALQQNELVLYYQPVIELENLSTVGAEALIRWNHHQEGMVSPGDFIPIAEDTGMIVEIGDWVIEEACRQCRAWRDSSNPDFHVAVNVSALQLKNINLPKYINDRLTKYNLPPEALHIEITESAFYGEDQTSLDILQQISEMKIPLLLDDFGTGYSSLSTLHGMPFDTIKIDRSFMNINHTRKKVMTQTIIDMAKNFDMQTVAEGVENQETVDYIVESGCRYVQGFYFQRPLPAKQLDITVKYDESSRTSNVTAIGNFK